MDTRYTVVRFSQKYQDDGVEMPEGVKDEYLYLVRDTLEGLTVHAGVKSDCERVAGVLEQQDRID